MSKNCRKLSGRVVNCREAFFPSPSRHPLLTFAELFMYVPFVRIHSGNHSRIIFLCICILAHQNRTIAIASDLRVDGAKSPGFPQKEWVLGSEIAARNRKSLATFHRTLKSQCSIAFSCLGNHAISGVCDGHRNRKSQKSLRSVSAMKSKLFPKSLLSTMRPPQNRKEKLCLYLLQTINSNITFVCICICYEMHNCFESNFSLSVKPFGRPVMFCTNFHGRSCSLLFRSRVGCLVSKKFPPPGSCPKAPASPPVLFVNEYQKPPVLPRFSSQMPPVLPRFFWAPPLLPRFSPHSTPTAKISNVLWIGPS